MNTNTDKGAAATNTPQSNEDRRTATGPDNTKDTGKPKGDQQDPKQDGTRKTIAEGGNRIGGDAARTQADKNTPTGKATNTDEANFPRRTAGDDATRDRNQAPHSDIRNKPGKDRDTDDTTAQKKDGGQGRP